MHDAGVILCTCVEVHGGTCPVIERFINTSIFEALNIPHEDQDTNILYLLFLFVTLDKYNYSVRMRLYTLLEYNAKLALYPYSAT